MPVIHANGIDIAYEFHGPDARPVLLLIQGLGMPSAAWPPRFVEMLVDAGFRVLCFDNRDIGQSELLDELGQPKVFVQALRHALHMKVRAPYRLSDMMRDADALLTGLGVSAAHVVGVSMGGMIAQLLALHVPERVTSLTSIMSTTNNRRLPGPRGEVRRFILRGPKDFSTAGRLAYHRKLWPMIGSPGHVRTDEEFEAFLERIFASGMPPSGVARQTVAIFAESDRVPRLRELRVPTLVIHGDADPLVPVECGYATAEAIPDAEMVVIEGMGHDLPDALLPRLTDLIIGHLRVSEVTASALANDAVPA